MDAQLTNDFVVETKGQCFLCSKQILFKPTTLNLESNQETSESVTVKHHSLQCLSRYLKMDMGKVFVEDGSISPHLLDKVRKSNLKVELCKECLVINDKFFELHQRLKKMEMDVNSHLHLILSKLENAVDGRYIGSIQTLEAKTEGSFDKGRRQVVETLRKEAYQNCSETLRNVFPKVPIQRLTKKDVEKRRREIKCGLRNETNKSSPNIPITLQSTEEGFSTKYNSEFGFDQDIKNDGEENESQFNGSELELDPENGSASLKSSNDPNHSSSSSSSTVTRKEESTDSGKVDLKYDLDAAVTGSDSDEDTDRKRTRLKSIRPRKKCIFNSKTGKRKCKECSKEFASVHYFAEHYKSAHLKISYKCSVCGQVFSQRSNCYKHQKLDHKDVPCRKVEKVKDPCKTLSSKPEYLANIPPPLKVTKKAGKPNGQFDMKSGKHKCRLCPKEYARIEGFFLHFRSIHLKERYECATCGKDFAYNYNYNHHYLNAHMGVRYKCNQCDKVFKHKQYMEDHQKHVHFRRKTTNSKRDGQGSKTFSHK